MTVLEFARKNGFKDIRQLRPWRGFACWEALYFDTEKIDNDAYIGFPQIILEKGGRLRMAGYDEAMAFIRGEK